MTPERAFVPFRRHHYEWLSRDNAKAESGIGTELTPGLLALLEAQNSWTAVVDGDPIACGGTLQHWSGRHQGWAFVAKGAGPHMPWLTLKVRELLANVKGRIEFTVRKDFRPGQRWARSLGFHCETPVLRAFGPEGEDHVGFVRFN